MKQDMPSDLGDDEEDDEGDEEGEGMQIAYAEEQSSQDMELKQESSPRAKLATSSSSATAIATPPRPAAVAPASSAPIPVVIDATVGDVATSTSEGEGITFVVNAMPRSDEDMGFSQAPGPGVAPPKAGKYALRRGKKVVYRLLNGGGGGGGSGGDGGTSSASTPSGTPLSERKKGKKVKTFDEWLEELRDFKNGMLYSSSYSPPLFSLQSGDER